MRRTAVVCTLFAATFGIAGTANASIAAASPKAGTGSHIHAARQAGKGSAAPVIKGSAASRKGASRAAGKRTAAPHVTVSAGTAGTKMVGFEGYTFSVPAGWPVYRLGAGSTQCVRYDINAVYLGTPGVNQQCPPGLIGQADTISISPCALASPSAYPVAELQSAQVGGAGEQRASLSVSATYGADPGAVGQVLQSMRVAKGGAPAVLHQSAPAEGGAAAPPAAQPGTCSAAAAGPGAGQAGTGGAQGGAGSPPAAGQSSATPSVQPVATPSGKPSTSPSAKPSTSPPVKPSTSPPATKPTPTPTTTTHLTAKSTGPMLGFDTCTAPSVQTMQAWRKTYSVAAIYIGGQEMACDYGNLSASWVQQVRKMGWSLIPIYVGLQAPCNDFHQEINPSHAAPEGTTAATTAVADAKALGLGQGGPVYFDMEGYNGGSTLCRNSVLSFLNAWTREVHTLHYVSGVYSSAASGAEDLGSATTVYGRALVKPDSMWFALWDNKANTVGTPYLLNSWWTPNRRIKQYQGGHWVKVGGAKLDIDSDWVQGAVY
jgi:glycoside hydrolase-like protein